MGILEVVERGIGSLLEGVSFFLESIYFLVFQVFGCHSCDKVYIDWGLLLPRA